MRFNSSTVFFIVGLCTGILVSSVYSQLTSSDSQSPDRAAVVQPSGTTVSDAAADSGETVEQENEETVDRLAVRKPAENEGSSLSQQIACKISGELQAGDTLSDSLSRHPEISADVKWQLIDKLSSCLDLRRLKPGDCYTIFLDKNDRLIRCEYRTGPLESYSINQNNGELEASQDSVPLEVKTHYINGRIDTSLFKAFSSLGEKPSLVYAFADIFASKIDFNREPRPGDRFEALCEKYYKDSQFIGYGNILYARYIPAGGEEYEGFFYKPDSGTGAYYARDGKELGTFFLKTPLPVFRLTSEFTWKRKHPILGVTRPHLGVDLAAPTGTPVRAVADGKVTFKGKRGGYGKQVILAHRNSYKTYYGHLSGFPRGLGRGDQVKQKQIIGYVGSTGLSTGPHLDYRLKRGERFLDPFATKFKPRSILKDGKLARFRESIDEMKTLLAQKEDKKVVLVRQMVLKPGDNIVFF